ncbi:MAG: hypothetical protein DBY06_01860 [Clostridiales bacterium]|nr:MAG: hypothetical protein DBY06_01860 [Clostridiales bacterium]
MSPPAVLPRRFLLGLPPCPPGLVPPPLSRRMLCTPRSPGRPATHTPPVRSAYPPSSGQPNGPEVQ